MKDVDFVNDVVAPKLEKVYTILNKMAFNEFVEHDEPSTTQN